MTNNRGGKETYIIGMYRELLKYGNQIDFLATDDHIVFEEEIKKNGSKVYHIPGRSKGLSRYNKNIKRIFEEEHYDVLWSHKTTLSSIEEFETAKDAGVKVRIIHSHCTKNMGNQFTAIMHAINRHRINHLANVFFACSEEAGEYFYTNKVKFTVTKNAFELSSFEYEKENELRYRKKFNFFDEFIVLHVGRFSPEKNHIKIINVFKEIRNIHPKSKLILCGSGSESERILIEEKIKKCNLVQDVIILENRDDINMIQQMANVFIFPSIHEGLPYALIEAQAASTPCVISSNISNEAIFSNGVIKLSIDESDNKWATTCLQYGGLDKIKIRNNLREKGFDLLVESRKINEFIQKKIRNK